MTTTPAGGTILVTGDRVSDHHLYEGEWHQPGAHRGRGVVTVEEAGGAACLHKLLYELFDAFNRRADKDPARGPEPEENWRAVLAPPPPDHQPLNSYAVWAAEPGPTKADGTTALAWRARHCFGYGAAPTSPSGTAATLPYNADAGILVVDDAAHAYRRPAASSAWPSLLGGKNDPEWILLKLGQAPAQGALWDHFKKPGARGACLLDRTCVIVSASELRRDHVRLSRGLSWEGTIEDAHDLLTSHPLLRELALARHLLITFSTDGVLWLDRSASGESATPRATLLFDAVRAEGEWRGAGSPKAFGFLNCLTAAVARGFALASSDSAKQPFAAIASAVAAGLSAMRDLHERGHGPVSDSEPPSGFPAKRLADAIRQPRHAFSVAAIPWPPSAPGASWSIARSSEFPPAASSAAARPPAALTGLARRIVLRGEIALAGLPHARFGKFLTTSRSEIETLRGIRQRMLAYRDEPAPKRPVSIGVFGPPGAGKSFAISEIATAIFGKPAWLEFNLSQFNGPADLIGALHQVRDRVLSGQTPVVFWDEFDSREYVWLAYLLAPMQDGRFQEGQITHPIGKCVFVFAGGTSHSYEAFGPHPRKDPVNGGESDAYRRFRLAKGTDFLSRLDTYYDVAGPNQRLGNHAATDADATFRADENDFGVALRRALFITAKLPPPKDDMLDIDPGLLTALLEVPRYKNGSRSLEKILDALRPPPGSRSVRRSSLPGPDVLAMHVEPVTEFNRLCRYDAEAIPSVEVDTIAAAIHENYRRTVKFDAPNPAYNQAFKDLKEDDKDPNRAAARRLPAIVAMVGLKVESGGASDADKQAIRLYLRHHLDFLAEAEHRGWMAVRHAAGWRYDAKRDDKAKHHDRLVPYADLPEYEKQKDRDAVLGYVDVLAIAGLRLVYGQRSR